MRGAVNHGATVHEVNAVRKLVMQICEIFGMVELRGNRVNGQAGWRNEVAKL
jgi:hypothetical protein